MELDHAALHRAIRPAMRRWWLRMGTCWAVLLLAPLACRYYYSQAIGSRFVLSSHGMLTPSSPPAVLGEVMSAIIWPGAVIIWTMAALHFNHRLSELYGNCAVPGGDRLARFRFTGGMRQGLIPVLGVAAAGFLYAFIHWAAAGSAAHSVRAIWAQLGTVPAHLALSLCALMIWIAAFITVTHGRPYLTWIWVLVLYLGPIPARIVYLATPRIGIRVEQLISEPGPMHFDEIPRLWFLAGAAVLMLAVWAFDRRLPVLGWPAYGLLLAGGLCEVLIRCGWLLHSVLMRLNRAQVYVPASSFISGGDNPLATIVFYIPGVPQLQAAVTFQPLLFALHLLINIAWLLLVYLFVSKVLLRPDAPQPAAPSAPAGGSIENATC